MRTALERGAKAFPSSAALPVGLSSAGGLLLGAAAALTSAALLFGGGSSEAPLTWIGGGAVALGAGVCVAALWGRHPWPLPSRGGLAFFALLGAFVLWNGISILWSILPDRSWSYFNRGLVYLAFAVIGLFLGAARPSACRRVAAGLALLLALVIAWALAGKVVPALFPDGARRARLREPVEYWNALALATAFALPLALWIASRRGQPSGLRATGAVLAYAAAVALVLTYSRGGIAVALAAVLLWLAIGGAFLPSVVAAGVATPVAAGVLAWAFGRPGIVDDLQPHATRVHDGAWLGVFLVGGGALVWAAFWVALRYEERWPLRSARVPGRWLAVAAAATALLVAGLVAGAVGPGEWLRAGTVQFVKGDPLPEESGRLTDLSSNNRWSWWGEAWEAFEGQPLAGTGAGSFELTHRLLRENAIVVTEPHNVPLQFLTELGLVGFALMGGAAAAAGLVVLGALRRLEGEERAAGAALATAPAAYLLHSLVDFDWDFVAVTAPVLLVVGVLAGAGRPSAAGRPRRRWALAAAGVGLVLLLSLATTWLAERKVNDAYASLETDPGRAAASARQARRLNPLSIEPLFALAGAEHLRGDPEAALRSYVDAVELQPLNPETWYQLGAYEAQRGNEQAARRHLGRSQALDRFGPAAALLQQLPPG